MAQVECLAKLAELESSVQQIIAAPSVQFASVTKRFGNLLANDAISCNIKSGGIHAFLGENGAGKSTLMKILCGHYQPDSGSILLNEKQVAFRSPSQARHLGIGMVHQQFTLVPSMTVLENVLLGDTNNPQLLRHTAQAERVDAKAKEFDIKLDIFSPIWRLSIAERQKVEILKLLWRDSKILILDEPTSQLAPFEAEDILLTMDKLSKEGRIVVLISHHIEEILRFSSHITVLRKGKCVANLNSHTVDANELAKLMVDTLVLSGVSRPDAPVLFPCLGMKDVSVKSTQKHRTLNSVNLDLYTGEVLGIAGVIGSGQDEIASILTGHLHPDAGSLLLDGHKASWKALKNPQKSAAYVPADAKKSSVASLTVLGNSMLRDVHRKTFLRGPFLRSKLIRKTAMARIEALDVRPNNPNALCGSLSGGNLQRLILARELDNSQTMLVAVNPTAGLDLAMTQRILQELRNAANNNKAVVLISPDLQELLTTCDRILVMCGGSVSGVERVENLDAESLGLLVGGVKLDVVRKLAQFLKNKDSSHIDPETQATLYELLHSDNTWQKRLAAQIALRVFTMKDLTAVQDRLNDEKNAECRAWLQVIQAKLGGETYFEILKTAFAECSDAFVEVQRRILKADDLKSMKTILLIRQASTLSDWEELLAKLVSNHLRYNLQESTPLHMDGQVDLLAQR